MNKLAENFGHLFFLKIFEYLLPLVILPYLGRTLGVEGFGLLSFVLVVVSYFNLVTDYGFNLYGVKKISQNRDNHDIIKRTIYSIFMAKLFIFLLCILIFLIVSFLYYKISSNINLFIYSIGITVGSIFFPVYLYQGLENMKYISILNIFSKLIFFGMICFLVRGKEDIGLVVLSYSFSSLILGVMSMYVVIKIFKYRIYIPKLKEIRCELKDSFHFFSASILTTLYTNANVIILSFFVGNREIGLYSAAERIAKALQSISAPFINVIYPRVSSLVLSSRKKAFYFSVKSVFFVFFVFAIVSSICFFFSKPITILLLGNEFVESISILRILAWLPLVCSIGGLGSVILMAFGEIKTFYKITLCISILGFFVSLLFTYFGKAIGLSFSVLSIEFLLMVFILLSVFRMSLKNLGEDNV